MENIIDALLDIERKAESAMSSIHREKTRLSARIAAETVHIKERVERETEAAIAALTEESQKSTEARILAIQEEGAKQLVDLEFDFERDRDAIRAGLMDKLQQWTP